MNICRTASHLKIKMVQLNISKEQMGFENSKLMEFQRYFLLGF